MTLGDKAPKTFETFRWHKRAGDDTHKAWYNDYRWEQKRISFRSFVGQTTATGVEITGVSKHVVDRAISRGFSAENALDALQMPVKLGNIVTDDKGQPSQRLRGKTAEIVIDPETGNLISGWRKGK